MTEDSRRGAGVRAAQQCRAPHEAPMIAGKSELLEVGLLQYIRNLYKCERGSVALAGLFPICFICGSAIRNDHMTKTHVNHFATDLNQTQTDPPFLAILLRRMS